MTILRKQPENRAEVQSVLQKAVDSWLLIHNKHQGPTLEDVHAAVGEMWPQVSERYPDFPWEPAAIVEPREPGETATVQWRWKS